MSKITEAVANLAKGVVEAEGCSLWDVEYVREAGSYYLRVYIDKPGGVSINDCEAISRTLDKLLDEADPIPDSYIFEVASAGAERELKRPSDFEAFLGSEVEVRTYKPINGQKVFVGTLEKYEDGAVTLSSGKKQIRIPESVSKWAMLMNVSRPSLHRELKKLESEGILVYSPPTIEILDKDALQNVLSLRERSSCG